MSGRSRHIPALDGLRGVAVMSVVSWHALRLPPAGILGVDLFFVLSGFLITSLLVHEWKTRDCISLASFYRRRALRLFPALFCMLAVYLLVMSALTLAGQTSAQSLRSALGGGAFAAVYASNFMQAFHPIEPDGMGHLWSLAQEEQFYLVWPFILILLLRRGTRPQRIAQGLALAAAAIVVYRLALSLAGADFYRLWFGPDTRADSVLIGCVAGIVYGQGLFRRQLNPRKVRRLQPVAVALAFAVLIGFSSHSRQLYEGALTIFCLACALLILTVSYAPTSPAARALSARWLRYLGRISYGVYLWHAPLIAAIGPLGALAALPVAAVSRRYVEEPFLQRRHRSRQAPAEATPAVAIEPAT